MEKHQDNINLQIMLDTIIVQVFVNMSLSGLKSFVNRYCKHIRMFWILINLLHGIILVNIFTSKLESLELNRMKGSQSFHSIMHVAG